MKAWAIRALLLGKKGAGTVKNLLKGEAQSNPPLHIEQIHPARRGTFRVTRTRSEIYISECKNTPHHPPSVGPNAKGSLRHVFCPLFGRVFLTTRWANSCRIFFSVQTIGCNTMLRHTPKRVVLPSNLIPLSLAFSCCRSLKGCPGLDPAFGAGRQVQPLLSQQQVV